MMNCFPYISLQRYSHISRRADLIQIHDCRLNRAISPVLFCITKSIGLGNPDIQCMVWKKTGPSQVSMFYKRMKRPRLPKLWMRRLQAEAYVNIFFNIVFKHKVNTAELKC